jgi:hypothetical protein
MCSVHPRTLDPMRHLVSFYPTVQPCFWFTPYLPAFLHTGNLCGTSSKPTASAQAAFVQWTHAGMPASKLLLGLPLYGYVWKSSKTKLSGSSAPNLAVGAGHSKTRSREPERTAAPAGDLSSMWGQQIAFDRLLKMGALKNNGDDIYVGANGYTMGASFLYLFRDRLVLIALAWDNCSDTPVSLFLNVFPCLISIGFHWINSSCTTKHAPR